MSNSRIAPPAEPHRRGTWLAFPATVAAALLIGLFLLILPGFIGVAILLGMGLLAIVAVGHYLAWGWWLGRLVHEERAEADSAERE